MFPKLSPAIIGLASGIILILIYTVSCAPAAPPGERFQNSNQFVNTAGYQSLGNYYNPNNLGGLMLEVFTIKGNTVCVYARNWGSSASASLQCEGLEKLLR